MQIDTPINAGNSGGGLFNQDGLLVGLVNAGQEYKDGLGFAIPSDKVLSVLNSLLSTYNDEVYHSYGYVEGTADIQYVTYEDSYNIWGESLGVCITSIGDKCSAYDNGLRAGYQITRVYYEDSDGYYYDYEVETASELSVFLYSLNLKAGDEITIYYINNRLEDSVTFVLGQYIYAPSDVPESDPT